MSFALLCLRAPDAVTADAAAEATEPRRRYIALTFDDGPSRATTPKLLDGLAQRGVHATFFLIGSQIEGNEDLVGRMEAEGHQVGFHSYSHILLRGVDRTLFDSDVGGTRQIIQRIVGHGALPFRPPYGLLENYQKNWACAPIILWSIDPEDWDVRDTDAEVEQIVSEARDGSIILLHDIYPESVAAALEVIDRLHAEGYYFLTVSDLAAERGVTLENGKMYYDFYPAEDG